MQSTNPPAKQDTVLILSKIINVQVTAQDSDNM